MSWTTYQHLTFEGDSPNRILYKPTLPVYGALQDLERNTNYALENLPWELPSNFSTTLNFNASLILPASGL